MLTIYIIVGLVVGWCIALTYLFIKFKAKVKTKVVSLKGYINFIKESLIKESELTNDKVDKVILRLDVLCDDFVNLEHNVNEKCPCKEKKNES